MFAYSLPRINNSALCVNLVSDSSTAANGEISIG